MLGDENDEIGDPKLAYTFNELCWVLQARQKKKIAALPLFERVMLLHLTILLRVWLWARTK